MAGLGVLSIGGAALENALSSSESASMSEREEPVRLTDLEIEVLGLLANDAEPTWILLEEANALEHDRQRLESVLTRLEERELVARSAEPSFNPASEAKDIDDWWTLTPKARRVLAQHGLETARPRARE